MKHDITPLGTHPHEWFMYHGAHYGYRMANAIGLESWVDVYQGNLGIALTRHLYLRQLLPELFH